MNDFKQKIRTLMKTTFLRLYSCYVIIKARKNYKKNKEDISGLKESQLAREYSESLIICNGPSVSEFLERNLEFTKNKTIFCVNAFSTTEYYEQLKPSFYILMDDAYFQEEHRNEFVSKLIPSVRENIKMKTKWKLVLIMPLQAKKWNWFQNLPNENNNISISYFNSYRISPKLSTKFKFKLYEKNYCSVISSNVAIDTIFISLNLGFKKLYLIGVDQSLHKSFYVGEDNMLYLSDNHFYKSDYTKPIAFIWNNHAITVAEYFGIASKIFGAFEELEEYSKFLGAQIYNLSKNSFVDAFKKMKTY